ncbi:RNA-binding domain-containing protein [Ancylobacter mangrovi]|uniref:RNA-binding domain-containing protein n=1 Tax=Ancylobacter mangrovi TaxID=2972472 RepID=UPI0021627FBD|nr:RNA-binding domain-containing protein [Ancylobacter mangrovi]MCS0505152.1 putative DNA binding domain-containing protein [Ancylobacter mangrovi]
MATRQEIEGYVAEPNETMTVEHKGWLDLTDDTGKAKLAKAAMALANSGGGAIVIGFREDNQAGRALLSEARPAEIQRYGADAVNAAIARYAKPPFHCDVHHATHPVTGNEHTVVIVPGDHRTPIMTIRDCDRVVSQNKVYVRKPGPKSEDARTPEEWSQVLDGCLRARRDDMLDAFRVIMAGSAGDAAQPGLADDPLITFIARAEDRWAALVANQPADAATRFPRGGYDIAIAIEGDLERPGLPELLRKIDVAHNVKLTGWPAFLVLNRQPLDPHPVEGAIETWLGFDAPEGRRFDDPGHQDFWWIAPEGLLYMKRGFQEDGLDRHAPGTVFDYGLPIWRTGEALLFARRLGAELGNATRLRFMFRWHGLLNRRLVSIDGRRMLGGDRTCRGVSEVRVEGSATVQQIDDNLAEVLFPVLGRLYEMFDFFPLSQRGVAEEIMRLRERRF